MELMLQPQLSQYHYNRLMEHLQDLDEETLAKQKNLWKVFGRNTPAGKALFSLYKSHDGPKIDYPKPKQKSEIQLEKERNTKSEIKKCPQMTQIEYPQLPKKTSYKMHMVDLIPKRKNQTVIRQEIDEFYSKVEVPANKGVDRQKQVNKLQSKFKNQRGALPKGAQLPSVQINQQEIDQQLIQKNAQKRVEKKFKNFTNIPNPNEAEQKQAKKTKIQQMDEIFDAIVEEISERQQYLDSISDLTEPKMKEMKEKVKQEIVERVSELSKITQMRKSCN